MTTLVFDTLMYSKRLRDAGFTQKQAEVQAEVMAEVIENRLATKDDLKHLRKDLDLKISETKTDLIKWMVGISIGQAAIIISCLRPFTHL